MYDALLEALKAGETNLVCSEFKELYEKLLQIEPEKDKSKLQQQFDVSMASSEETSILSAQYDFLLADILPLDTTRMFCRVRLTTHIFLAYSGQIQTSNHYSGDTNMLTGYLWYTNMLIGYLWDTNMLIGYLWDTNMLIGYLWDTNICSL